MTQTHTSYAVSKALKEFLGESAPEPIDGIYIKVGVCSNGPSYPRYALHDLLSKPFCEAFVNVGKVKFGFNEDEVTDFTADWSTEMAYAFWNGGLPAVEAELMRMMGKEE